MVESTDGNISMIQNEVKISIVIPAFHAERYLAKVVDGIPGFVENIIIVDDCSKDNTLELAVHLASKNPKIKIIKHPSNQGVGGAMLSGYDLAYELKSDIIVKMDSDDQMDPNYIKMLIKPILRGEADYSKGNRFLNIKNLSSMPFLRRLGNLGLSFMTKAATGYWNIFDPTNGFTAIYRSIIPMLDKSRIAKRYFFETSMLLQLNLIRAVIKDVPIPSRYGKEDSNLSELKTIFEFPPRLIKGMLFRLWVQYFVQDFNLYSIFLLSGLFLFTFGIIFGAYHWIISAQAHVVTPTGTVMIAVLPVILGVQFLLQAISLDVQNVPKDPLQNDIYNGDEL
jgi:dolichol-phosphate mannosyltransferase